MRSVWSSKMPLANTPVIPNLLDAPTCEDPAFYIVWTRFRTYATVSCSSLVGGFSYLSHAGFDCSGNWVCLGRRAARLVGFVLLFLLLEC